MPPKSETSRPSSRERVGGFEHERRLLGGQVDRLGDEQPLHFELALADAAAELLEQDALVQRVLVDDEHPLGSFRGRGTSPGSAWRSPATAAGIGRGRGCAARVEAVRRVAATREAERSPGADGDGAAR